MISKDRALTLLGVFTLAMLASPGCSRKEQASAGPAAPGQKQLLKVNFKLDWYPTAEHGGFYQALVKGYYRDAGLDVTILAGGPGAYPLPFVATDRADLGMGRFDDVIVAVRQGLPLVAVCAQMEHDPQAVMVHEEGPVKTFKDLDGRTVMSSPGSNWVAFIQKRYGVSFNLIPMDYGLGRFMSDKGFIQQVFISSEPFFVEQQGVKPRVLLISSGGYDPYRVVIANRGFAREHPEAVRAFVAATVRGYREYLAGQGAEANAMIIAQNPSQSPAIIGYTIETLNKYQLAAGDPAKGERLGLLTRERCEELVRELVDIKVLDAPIPLSEFVSFDFLPPGGGGPAK